MQTLNVDKIFDLIGHLGKVQFIYFLALGGIQIFICQHMLLNIYTGLEPSFLCYSKDGISGKTEPLYNECIENNPSKCILKYNSTYTSFASEWDLVCNESYWVALVQSIWMAGVMTGALVLGGVADRFGRLITLHLAITGTIVMEGFSSFSTNYFTFVCLRFFGGVSCAIVILASFVLLQELVGRSKRSLVGVSLSAIFALGIGILSFIASSVNNWRTLTFLSAAMGLPFLLVPCFVPESPRWLIGKGKKLEAEKILKNMALANNRSTKLPVHWQLESSKSKSVDAKNQQSLSILMSHSYLVTVMLVLIFSWLINGMVYYALTLASTSMKGNVYIVTTLNGLVEIPANIIALFAIDRYGRRPTIVWFMIMGGISCICIPTVATIYPYAVSVMALFGKLSISSSFSVIYIHSSEIFPTCIRNGALGIVSVAARVGGIASPLVLMLNDVRQYSHFFVLGLLTLAAGILNLRLPETLGQPMPESIEDVLALNQGSDSPKKT